MVKVRTAKISDRYLICSAINSDLEQPLMRRGVISYIRGEFFNGLLWLTKQTAIAKYSYFSNLKFLNTYRYDI